MSLFNMCCPKKPKKSLDYIIKWIDDADKTLAVINDAISALQGDVKELEDWKENISSETLQPIFDEYAEIYPWDQVPEFGAKADKVESATAGNLAALDSNGNLQDSGNKVSDFALKVPNATTNNLVSIGADGNLQDSGINKNFVTNCIRTTDEDAIQFSYNNGVYSIYDTGIAEETLGNIKSVCPVPNKVGIVSITITDESTSPNRNYNYVGNIHYSKTQLEPTQYSDERYLYTITIEIKSTTFSFGIHEDYEQGQDVYRFEPLTKTGADIIKEDVGLYDKNLLLINSEQSGFVISSTVENSLNSFLSSVPSQKEILTFVTIEKPNIGSTEFLGFARWATYGGFDEITIVVGTKTFVARRDSHELDWDSVFTVIDTSSFLESSSDTDTNNNSSQEEAQQDLENEQD